MCDENKELQQENRIFLLIATPAWKLYSFGVIQAKYFFFFYQGLLSQTLTIHWKAE